MRTASCPPSVSNQRRPAKSPDSSAVLFEPTSAPIKSSSLGDVETGPENSVMISPLPRPRPESPSTTTTPQPARVEAFTF